jgi:hypothetical protein
MGDFRLQRLGCTRDANCRLRKEAAYPAWAG